MGKLRLCMGACALVGLAATSLAGASLGLPPVPGVVTTTTETATGTTETATGTTETATGTVTETTTTTTTTATTAPATSCPGQSYVQPFLPWLDPASYVLMPNGSLESSRGWTLAGGAKLVSGNETYRVNSSTDTRSLYLPSGSSATTPSLCITLLHPDLRFFAVNKGSLIATLKVEAITQVLGVTATTPIGVLVAGGSWQPTLPLLFLDNLTALTGSTIAFRFTPSGAKSGWRIDDVYVDPFHER